jgi:phage regulator Rha-like protein
MTTIKLNKLVFQFVGLFITFLIIVSDLDQQSGEDFHDQFDEDFRELRKDIMEIKKEIGMFLKENQTDSQN